MLTVLLCVYAIGAVVFGVGSTYRNRYLFHRADHRYRRMTVHTLLVGLTWPFRIRAVVTGLLR